MQYDFHLDYNTQNGSLNQTSEAAVEKTIVITLIITKGLKMINSAARWTQNVDKQDHVYAMWDTESSGKRQFISLHAFKKRFATGLLFVLLFWKKT